ADKELILSEGRPRIIVPLSHQQVSPWPFKGLASGTKKAEREGVFSLERAAPGLQVSAWFSACPSPSPPPPFPPCLCCTHTYGHTATRVHTLSHTSPHGSLAGLGMDFFLSNVVWSAAPAATMSKASLAGVSTARPKVNPLVICFTAAQPPSKHKASYQAQTETAVM
ncbi:Histone acetyltransferase KAT2B, partial [Dissostichus eleginoides]